MQKEANSITINFHSRRGQETYVKAKKCSKFRRRAASLHISMFKLILQVQKLAFLPMTSSNFAVILSAVSSPIVQKVEFSFELILYITIFVF